MAETEKEGKDRQNELLEYKTTLKNIEAMLSNRNLELIYCEAERDVAKTNADAASETCKSIGEKHKNKVRKVKEEVQKLKGEVEKLKKEAAESSQEATKAKRSLEDFQELEEVIERVQKKRIV